MLCSVRHFKNTVRAGESSRTAGKDGTRLNVKCKELEVDLCGFCHSVASEQALIP